MSLIGLIRTFLILVTLCSLSNCGGEVQESLVSITPNRPLIYNDDRTIFIDLFNTIRIQKPSIIYQLKINNTGNSRPLTITSLRLTVEGPKGTKVISVDPLTNLFKINGVTFSQEMRAFFAEVPPYQASYCMDKVNFLRETDYSRSCDDIEADSANTIQNFGVSAIDTDESADGLSCCPIDESPGNLANIYIITGGLQEYSNEELVPDSLTLSIRADILGFVGTFAEPVANYRSQYNFTPSSN